MPRPSSLPKCQENSAFGNVENHVHLLYLPFSSIFVFPPRSGRLVPPQTPENVDPLVYKYLDAEFKKLKSKNTLVVEQLHGGKPWVENHKHWNYEAAKRATEVNVISAPLSIFKRTVRWLTENGQQIYKQTPDLTREGGSIPVTLTFAEALGVNVLLLPMGRGDDGAQ